MKTFNDAFFEGIVNPTLAAIWKSSTNPMATKVNPYHALICRRLCVKLTLLCLLAYLLDVPARIGGWGYCENLLVAIPVTIWGIAYLAWFNGADLRFLMDCYKLKEELNAFSVHELVSCTWLQEHTELLLVGLAKVTLEHQAKIEGLEKAQQIKKKFKKAHKLFYRFRLVEQEWGVYFTKAEQQMAAAVTAAV